MNVEDANKLLVKHGFIKPSPSLKYSKNDKGVFEGPGGTINPDDANVEYAEEVNVQAQTNPNFSAYLPTGYPDPAKRLKIIFESATANIEEPYFWMLEHLRQDQAYPYVEKITDIFSASEQSAFWGASQARIGIQQDRVSQYLKGISEMVKQLFQLVRELRIIDEKLAPRNEWGKSNAADITLKGEYADLVENRGGQMQPGGIWHLSQTVGYAVLPDLFFNTHVYKLEDVDSKVDSLKFNQNVRNVVKRKLFSFVNWKLNTDKELNTRRTFTLRYLRQHWNTIKMYMNWVKPYLRNIARLQMNPTQLDSPDIVSGFETSIIELELIAYQPTKSDKRPCILMSFKFRTRPELTFQKDQYAHKGPSHYGRVEVTFRSYAWTDDQIKNYKNMKKEEDMMLLGLVDETVKAAMEALGDELEKYLWEAGEKEFEEKRKKKELETKEAEKKKIADSANMLEPFGALLKGFMDMGSMFNPIPGKGGSGGSDKPKSSGKEEVKKATDAMYMVYKNYKKSHGLLSA